MKRRLVSRALFISAVLMFLAYSPPASCRENPLSAASSFCRWNEDGTAVKKRIREHTREIEPVPSEKLADQDNYILSYILNIDENASGRVELYKTTNREPYSDFLFYRGRLCAVSFRKRSDTDDLFDDQTGRLSKQFGTPVIKKTDTSLTHSYSGPETTVLLIRSRSDGDVVTHTYFYPTDLFKRLLSP
ncbi:MAG: hypothetical protein ACOC2H_04235 [Spirochaetota bacterium]